jgi:hypothetical protein
MGARRVSTAAHRQRDSQAAWAAALLNPAQPCPSGLTSPDGDAARRFGIHRNNVAVAWITALAENFPATQALIGATAFVPLALSFAREHPPRTPVLALWGEDFPEWLQLARLPGPAALAQLEWLRVRAYYAADADALPVSELASRAADASGLDRVRLRLHPSVSTIAAGAPIVHWWSAAMRGERLRRDECGREAALVRRDRDDVLVIPRDAPTVAFVDALRGRLPLAAAAETAGLSCDGIASALVPLIRHAAIVGWEDS